MLPAVLSTVQNTAMIAARRRQAHRRLVRRRQARQAATPGVFPSRNRAAIHPARRSRASAALTFPAARRIRTVVETRPSRWIRETADHAVDLIVAAAPTVAPRARTTVAVNRNPSTVAVPSPAKATSAAIPARALLHQPRRAAVQTGAFATRQASHSRLQMFHRSTPKWHLLGLHCSPHPWCCTLRGRGQQCRSECRVECLCSCQACCTCRHQAGHF